MSSEISQWLDLAINGKKVVKSADTPIEADSPVEIEKGDLPGHPFRGNQWTTAADAQGDLFPANNLHLQHSDDASASEVAGQHEIAAELHTDQKNRLKELAQKAVDEGHPVTAGKLVRAIGAHADAALEHQNAAKATRDNGIGQDSVNAAYLAVEASRDANAATYAALEDASATGLAPADLMKSAEITKGDFPGHPFRGNQWTHGQLSDRASAVHATAKDLLRTARNGGTSEDSQLTAPDFADIHRDYADEHRLIAGQSTSETARIAHERAAAAHESAAQTWSDPSKVFSGSALRSTELAADAARSAEAKTLRDAEEADRQATGSANNRPTDSRGNPIVTKDSPAVMVPTNEATLDEQSKYFRIGGEGPKNFGGQITLPDGMVNPLTGETGSASKQSYGYTPDKTYMVVQGERPGGSVFTRVLEHQSAMRLGDRMSFYHDQTGRSIGSGKIIGIVDPSTGRAFGNFPDKKLSFHVYK